MKTIPYLFKAWKRLLVKYSLLLSVIIISISVPISCTRNQVTITNSDIKMNVWFSLSLDGAFAMRNNDYFTWYNIDVFLNYSDNLSSGYKYHLDKINSGVNWVIDPYEFKNNEGDYYSVYFNKNKPIKVFIQAETADAKRGSYFKTWQLP